MVKDGYGVEDAVVDEFNSVGLRLNDRFFFYLEINSATTALMFFLLQLPMVMTEAEIHMVNEVVQSQRSGLVAGVEQLPGCELVFFNMLEEQIDVDLLSVVLSEMIQQWKEVFACVDKIYC
jgi:hypothetical protein